MVPAGRLDGSGLKRLASQRGPKGQSLVWRQSEKQIKSRQKLFDPFYVERQPNVIARKRAAFPSPGRHDERVWMLSDRHRSVLPRKLQLRVQLMSRPAMRLGEPSLVTTRSELRRRATGD